MSNLITPDQFFKRAAAIMAAQDRAAQVEAITTNDDGSEAFHMVRTYRENTEEMEVQQPRERWTNATHHSLGNGCYQSRRQGGAE